jgi:nitrogen-specific signal transduction histidine kinase
VLASSSPVSSHIIKISMSNTEINLMSEPNDEVEAALSHLLHEFRNQLGGLKLYAAFLKKSLANNTLSPQEGIEICDKIIQQVDALTVRAKEATRSVKISAKS